MIATAEATSTIRPRDRQDTAASDGDVQSFVEQGYLVKQGLVGPEELVELKADVLKLAKGGYPCSNLQPLPESTTEQQALEQILCMHQPHYLSPVIRRFTVHPGIAGVLGRITGAHLHPSWWDGSVKCMQSMYFVKPPGKPGQAWHQDEIYIPTRDRSLIGAWIAVDDATIDNGCLWVLPGSHREGVLFHQRKHENPEFDFASESCGFDDSAEVPVEVPAGSVVFFNGYLLHRSRKNRSQRYRRALVSHYCSAQTFLPWVQTNQDPPVAVAQADVRRVHMVCGSDPHAHRGYEEPKKDVWLRHYAGAERKPNPLENTVKPLTAPPAPSSRK